MTKNNNKIDNESASFILDLNVDEYRKLTVNIKKINREIPEERFVDWFMEDLLFEFPKNGIQQRWTLDEIDVWIGENNYSDSQLEAIRKDFSTISNWDVYFKIK